MSRWVDPMTPADWSARAAWSDTLRRRQEQVARERAIAATAEPKVKPEAPAPSGAVAPLKTAKRPFRARRKL